MSHLGRARGRFVFLVLAVLCGAGALGAPAASAEPLGAVAGPVTETVAGPVHEIVEALPPPVQEATEAATAPVEEATQVAPPVREVTEAATAPVEAVKETVTPPAKAVTETVAPAAKAIAETVRHPSASPPVKPPSAPTTRVTETAGTVGKDLPTSKRASSSAGPDPTSSPVGSPQDPADQGSASAPSVVGTGARHGNVFVPSPAIDGSTAAPLPRWLAYIWPAIALLRPGLTGAVDHLEAAVRLALGTGEGLDDRTSSGPVVAGVHASGGRPEQADSPSSPSPFSKITSAVGSFPYNGAGAALGYLLIVTIMVIALYGAVRWEIARGRREGRG